MSQRIRRHVPQLFTVLPSSVTLLWLILAVLLAACGKGGSSGY